MTKKNVNLHNLSFNILIFKTSLLCSTFKNTTFCEDTKTIAKKAEQYYEIIIKAHIIRPFCNRNFHKQKSQTKNTAVYLNVALLAALFFL